MNLSAESCQFSRRRRRVCYVFRRDLQYRHCGIELIIQVIGQTKGLASERHQLSALLNTAYSQREEVSHLQDFWEYLLWLSWISNYAMSKTKSKILIHSSSSAYPRIRRICGSPARNTVSAFTLMPALGCDTKLQASDVVTSDILTTASS